MKILDRLTRHILFAFLGVAFLASFCFGQVIDSGIDTTLAEFGLNGPDLPHGEEGTNPDGVERWEFDGEDAGGVNHGLLWMDIPDNVLNGFGGTATLALHVDNNGHAADMYRMTADWLSGPDGGDEVTWENIPDGPGIAPGDNAQAVSNVTFPDSIGRGGQVIFVDVTTDVQAWADGAPNYGWGFVPIPGATDGTGITSFENLDNPVPTLTIINQEGVFPDQRLDGPAGTAGNWGVIDYYNGFTATQPAANVVQQVLQIQNGDIQADSATGQVPILDMTDPDTNANGGPTLSSPPTPFLSNDLTSTAPDDNDVISVAHGRIRVKEAGKYTFNIHSDDGFAFRINSAQFSAVGGNGSLDARSADTVLHAGDTGDSNTRAVVDLEARDYDVEFLSWERGGGAFYELTAQKGEFVTVARETQPQWLGVGDPSELPERTEGLGSDSVAVMTKPMLVKNFNNVAAEDQPLDFARDVAFDLFDDADAESEMSLFVIDDHNVNPGGCPFGRFNHDGVNFEQWPNTAGNVDNFVSLILGAFSVDDGDETAGEKITVTFHVDSDDRSYFRVIGESFEEVDAQDLIDIEGDESMYADVNTCNTDFSGVISLTEGVEYEFEALQVEAGGDAGMQVLAAAGDQLFADPLDAAGFAPLIFPGGATVTFARNIGFELVPETAGDPCDFDGSGVLDIGDIDLLSAAIVAGDMSAKWDANGDGSVSDADLNFLVTNENKIHTWVGDANLDGEFTSTDLVTVFQDGLFETGRAATWGQGDWNADGVFDSTDFVAAFQDGGFELGPRWQAVASVPEPTGLVLCLLGSVVLLRRRKA